MATEEEESDVSLKEIVQQTLEARGLFASIRAQLMASVFEVYTQHATDTCAGELCDMWCSLFDVGSCYRMPTNIVGFEMSQPAVRILSPRGPRGILVDCHALNRYGDYRSLPVGQRSRRSR